MKMIDQSHEILFITPDALQLIEWVGRICYKSEAKITEDSASKFIRLLIKSGHESVLEHAVMTVKFITNRGVTHELVRHRLASYSQESTRYVKYGDVEFINSVWPDNNIHFKLALEDAAFHYAVLINSGWKPEQAREVLPNALKSEIIMTANFREWRHVFKLRTSTKAHPQIRSLMINCLSDVKSRVPIVFDDILGGENEESAVE